MSNPNVFHTIEYLKHSLRQIIEEVDRIRKTADSEHIFDQLFNNLIRPVLENYYPVISPLAEHHSCTVYRTRRSSVESPFADILELLNPPVSSGRARGADDIPILYASSSMQTCLSEAESKIGEVFAVVQLDYSQVKDQNFWFVGQRHTFTRSGEQTRYLADPKAVKLQVYYRSAAQLSWIFCDSLINEIFSEISSDNDNYRLNRFVIEELTQNISPAQSLAGLIFNSTKCLPGTNFAFFGESIARLVPKIVNLVRIEDIDDYGYIAHRVLKNVTPKDGHLNWSDHEIVGS